MKTASQEKTRKPSKTEELDAYLKELSGKIRMDGWNQLTESVKAPAEVMAALMTGRPELARTAPARALSVEECKALYHLLAVLIETNYALQRHAQETAKLVKNWGDAFTTLDSLGRRIERFANFQPSSIGVEDEGDEE